MDKENNKGSYMPQQLMVSDKSSTSDQRSFDIADKVGEGIDGKKVHQKLG